MKVNFVNNSDAAHRELEQRLERALTECGMSASDYAKLNITDVKAVDTGALRNSITYKVRTDEKAVYIGSNLDYAKHIEFGTGEFVKGGRPTPWAFQDRKGQWHMTTGQKARPYLKPSITENADEYKQIIERNMKDA